MKTIWTALKIAPVIQYMPTPTERVAQINAEKIGIIRFMLCMDLDVGSWAFCIGCWGVSLIPSHCVNHASTGMAMARRRKPHAPVENDSFIISHGDMAIFIPMK